MRRTPLLVFATIIAVLVSSFLVFTTLSARSIVENNTLRWQNGTHVVVFLDDRVTTTAHKQLQESLESDEAKKQVHPTEVGVEFVETRLGITNLYENTQTNFIHYLTACGWTYLLY